MFQVTTRKCFRAAILCLARAGGISVWTAQSDKHGSKDRIQTQREGVPSAQAPGIETEPAGAEFRQTQGASRKC